MPMIDFDDVTAPRGFALTGPLTTEYAAQGVTFSGGGAILNSQSGWPVAPRSGNNFLAFNPSTYATGPATIDFALPISSFSIFCAVGTGPGGAAGVRALAYDAGGAEVARALVWVGYAHWRPLSVRGAGIVRVVVIQEVPFVPGDPERPFGADFIFDDLTWS